MEPREEQDRVLALFSKFSSIFAQGENDLGHTSVIKHSIPTIDDHAFKVPYRRIPPNQISEVKEYFQQMLKKGIIRPSTSEYCSPVVLVRKKSGALRICVDYRLLNSKTRKDAYPLPRIEESMDAISGRCFPRWI